MARRTINDLLAEAQARLPRLSVAEAAAAMDGGTTLVDTGEISECGWFAPDDSAAR